MTQKQIPQLQRDALLSESLVEVIYFTQLRYFDALKGEVAFEEKSNGK